jgi:3-oxoadipate enol-lactonase
MSEVGGLIFSTIYRVGRNSENSNKVMKTIKTTNITKPNMDYLINESTETLDTNEVSIKINTIYTLARTFWPKDSNYEASKDKNNVLNFVICHGLGEKNHDTELWTPIIGLGVKQLPMTSVGNLVFYTSRGHGQSMGWEDTAFTDPGQFTWPRLADDMAALIDSFKFSRAIVGGESMGSATAFYTALNYPNLVEAVIMMRPPTAWETRIEQRQRILSRADQLEAEMSTEYPALFHQVFRGTACSDLPSLETETHLYQQIQCPVLILATRHDHRHPESTAISLHGLLPKSQLHIVDSLDDAIEYWPKIIQEFLQQLKSS